MLRIVLTGPESCGKTTLAQQLAAHYRVPWVPEYARTYLHKNGLDYQEEDLLKIAKGQLYRENRIGAGKPSMLFCDTDLVTIKIWAEYKYGKVDPWILEQVKIRSYDYYFLCGIDIPWQDDPQREHPAQREELFQIYSKELRSLGKPFSIIEGDLPARLQLCNNKIKSLLASKE